MPLNMKKEYRTEKKSLDRQARQLSGLISKAHARYRKGCAEALRLRSKECREVGRQIERVMKRRKILEGRLAS